MISDKTAKLIQIMPKGVVAGISKRVVRRYLKKYANIHIKGKENLENIELPTIFVCNHLSNADGLVLSEALKVIDPTFVAGVKLSDNAVTNIGIHVVKTTNIQPGTADNDGIKRIIKLIKGGESILIFPEGTRSRVGSLIEAKRGPLLIARMTGAPIIPIGVFGTEKLMPINQEGDMSAEDFHHADVHIHIGKQFRLPAKQEGQDKKAYEGYATEYMMKEIAALLPKHYRGVYK